LWDVQVKKKLRFGIDGDGGSADLSVALQNGELQKVVPVFAENT
jgi:hypothetical protein